MDIKNDRDNCQWFTCLDLPRQENNTVLSSNKKDIQTINYMSLKIVLIGRHPLNLV